MMPERIPLKSPYRRIEGESDRDRAMRIHREARLRARYKKAFDLGKNADRGKVAEAMVQLDRFARLSADKDWKDINWDEFARLSRRVTFEVNRWRMKRDAEAIKSNMRNAGMIE